MTDLPTREEVLDARAWLMAGAPAASREHEPAKHVRVLVRLIHALPKLSPAYHHDAPPAEPREHCPECGHRSAPSIEEQAVRIAMDTGTVTPSELAMQTGCSKATAHTVLSGLHTAGRLNRFARGVYEPPSRKEQAS